VGKLEDSAVPDNGGQAFPHEHHRGMTLRDWFAGQALSAVITFDEPGKPLGMNAVAFVAYQIADAMIAERAQPIPEDKRRQLVAALKSRRVLPGDMLAADWTSRDGNEIRRRLGSKDNHLAGFCVLPLNTAADIAAILSRRDK
jgi:hypothetical protein